MSVSNYRNPEYAELHAVSNFSFLRGASHPEELVQQARELGYTGLALTDECSLAGVVRAHVANKDAKGHARADEQVRGNSETDFKLIIGSEFALNDGPRIVLLATTQAAYASLSGLITRGRRAANKGHYSLSCADIEREAGDCAALLLPEIPLPQAELAQAKSVLAKSVQANSTLNSARNNRASAADSTKATAKAPARATAETIARATIETTAAARATPLDPMQSTGWFCDVFGDRGWLAVELLLEAADRRWSQHLMTLSRHFKLPLVAAGDVHMHQRGRRALQDTLTAIRHGITVQRAGLALHPNGERHLRSRERLAKLYPPEMLVETLRVAERCNFSLDQLRYEYPQELVPEGTTPAAHIRKLTEDGVRLRWPKGEPAPVRKLIEHELKLIRELDYERYFLTVHDIVRFARSQNILCQGRGSAANSAVCYCLGITEVDPARMTLLFERFISKERNEPPDIDVDFEHERREEIIQYIYRKYGRQRAALTATVIAYRPKSALRDVGKALGMSIEQVNRLSATISWWDNQDVLRERIEEAGFDPANPIIIRLMILVNTIIGFPRHLSQHVGGFIISDQPLSNIVPIENAAMADRTVIQWDKDDIEALGLLKVDCLALGMLTAIHRAFDYVATRRGVPFSMPDVPAEDPAVYAMIQKADTVGVFQIESRAQMSMLPRLRPENFYDLVIEVAIVRPGPIQGDMVHPYLRRRQGLEQVSYPSDEVRAVLERTLGVPIFQEQVIKLAMVAAGFSPGEADGLRRSMAAWKKKGGLEPWEKRLKAGMAKRGYSDEYAERIFRQIMGFGDYGFPESHSASFSLLVYISAWLKCHEPAAFTCALLNSQPMGFYAPAQLVSDAKRNGKITVRPVDVNQSDWDCTLEPGDRYTGQPALRLGLRMVRSLSTRGVEKLLKARKVALFRSSDDLAKRARLNRRDLEALAAADALHALSGHRHRARWDTAVVENSANAGPAPLLNNTCVHEATPMLRKPTDGEEVISDYSAVGLSLRHHPLELLRNHFNTMGISSAEAVNAIPHGEMLTVAGLVITRQRPASAKRVAFLTLEDESGVVNVVVWQDLADRQRRELVSARLIGIYGEVQREDNVTHVIAHRLDDLTAMLGALPTQSRDFR